MWPPAETEEQKPAHIRGSGRTSLVEQAANLWNRLPEQVADTPTLNGLKARLDKLWSEYRYCQHSIHYYYTCHSHHGERPDLQQALSPIKQMWMNVNVKPLKLANLFIVEHQNPTHETVNMHAVKQL